MTRLFCYKRLPELPIVSPEEADIAWLVYTMESTPQTTVYNLIRKTTVYTQFQAALDTITIPHVGDVHDFLALLQRRLEKERVIYPPINLTLLDTPSEEE